MSKTKQTEENSSIDLDEFFDDTVKLELEGFEGEELEAITEAAKKANFVSIGEFIRHALRDFMESEEAKAILKGLKAEDKSENS